MGHTINPSENTAGGPGTSSHVFYERIQLIHRRNINATFITPNHTTAADTTPDEAINMPPALHPRSSMTLSLFTSTLAISFLVVGLPHLIPCPVQPQAYADDGTPIPRRRRRREVDSEGENGEANVMRDQPVSRGKVKRREAVNIMRWNWPIARGMYQSKSRY